MKSSPYRRPPLKYAGCKFELLDKILPLLPVGQRLIEPFAGSCVVGLNASRFASVWANDVNADLINLYTQITDSQFACTCRSLFSGHRNNKASYLALRGLFNAKCLSPLDRAAVFVYFNRHCYNGLCRYNSDGGFNVPFGRYDNPRFPCREIIEFQKFAKRATFTCLDFGDVMDQAQPGDVVYADPPYIPLSDTADFTSYAGVPFGNQESARLNQKAIELRNRGIYTVISNSNTQATLALFSGATRVLEVTAHRRISRDPSKRGEAKEVLLVYQP